MLLPILSQIPLWVFPLFLGLLWLGLRATRTRRVPVLVLYLMPLMGLLTLNRAVHLPESTAALMALALGALVGGAIGFTLQGRWILSREARHVVLRGEWLTLAVVMGLFWENFAAGMVAGMAPGVVSGLGFALVFGLGAGVLSGVLMGRAVRVGSATGF
ncbi:hypothetical protein LCM17_22265 [Cereibacter sphaeroides]|nr:hypothetical protein [Cereibacter sphaeroides]